MIDDAIRAKILSEMMICQRACGYFEDILCSIRLNTLIHDIIRNSRNTAIIDMSDGIKRGIFALRSFMFENVYTNGEGEKQEGKAKRGLLNFIWVLCDAS